MKKPGKSARPAMTFEPPSPVSSDEPPPTIPPHPAGSQEADEQVPTRETTLV